MLCKCLCWKERYIKLLKQFTLKQEYQQGLTVKTCNDGGASEAQTQNPGIRVQHSSTEPLRFSLFLTPVHLHMVYIWLAVLPYVLNQKESLHLMFFCQYT